MYHFHFTQLSVIVRFLTDGKLPKYKGSALRGGLGRQLLEMYCVGEEERCEECFLREKCIVQNVMYAPFRVKPDFVTEGGSAGYTLSCTDTRTQVSAGNEIEVRLILYGDVVAYFNPIIQALFGLGQKGLGKDLIPFGIVAVRNRQGVDILGAGTINVSKLLTETGAEYIEDRKEELGWNDRSRIRLRFLSPCAIKRQGKIMTQFQEEALFQAVWRRVYMQHLFEGYVIEPMMLRWEAQIKGQHAELQQVGRYSQRNQEKMNLLGITGWMELENVNNGVLELLLAGEITCVGKNTRFGFGVYQVEALED